MTKNETILHELALSADPFWMNCAALPAQCRVAGFHSVESISRPYAFDIYVVTEGSDLDVEQSVGANTSFGVEVPGGTPLVFHGMLAEVEHLRAVQSTQLSQQSSSSLYRARLVPRLWALGATLHSRVFTRKTIIEVILLVLSEEGIDVERDVELRLSADYPVEEHVCQYKESSLDFISRWMEREGIVYFFEQAADRERMVIADDKSFHAPCPGLVGPVRYHPVTGADWSAEDHFDTLVARKTSTARRIRLTDYDYAKPNLDLSAVAAVAAGRGGERSNYGNRYFSEDAGRKLAQIRSEELRASSLLYELTGSERRLHAGRTFEVEAHPHDTYNMRYLAVEVLREGRTPSLSGAWGDVAPLRHEQVYWTRVAALPAAIQYRSPSRTPWPRIEGYENGHVDGEKESAYAQIDEQGRYLISLRFDEGTLRDGKSSTWIRMMQPHGGGAEGFHFPLRKHTEVICTFLDGDPDRPIILGVVPNLVTPSPVTKANETQNILQTGGETYLCIDDQAGGKFASLNCPYLEGQQSELYLGIPRPQGAAGLTLSNGPQRTQMGLFAKPISQPSLHLRTTGTGMVSTEGPLDLSAVEALQLESDTDIVLYSPTLHQHTAGFHQVQVDGASEVKIAGTHTLWVSGASTQTYWTGVEFIVTSGDEVHSVTSDFRVSAAIDVMLTATQAVRVFGLEEVDIGSTKRIEISTGGASIILENDTITLEAKRFDVRTTEATTIQAIGKLDLSSSEKLSMWASTIGIQALEGDLDLHGGPMVKINT